MFKKSDVLLPCPYCGERAELIETKHIPNGIDYTPRCTDTSCCGRLSKKYSLKVTAVTKWNTRSNVVVTADDIDKQELMLLEEAIESVYRLLERSNARKREENETINNDR